MSKLALKYSKVEDRLLLTVKDATESNVWITRALALDLVACWAQKIEDQKTPEFSIANQTIKTNIAIQHQLAIENNEINRSKKNEIAVNDLFLAKKIRINFKNNESKIEFSNENKKISLNLSGKEVHAVLEMFQLCTNEAKWRHTVRWPDWLS